MGEGFFLAVMQKKEGEDHTFFKASANIPVLSRNEKQIVEKWMNPSGFELIKNNSTVYAWPSALKAEMEFILENLRVMYSGIRIGELVREKLIPDHALAMSGLITRDIPRTELSLDSAIEYLRKDPLKLSRATGWYVVSFQNHPLGWINILEKRVNNYYPKELRILKER
jgi:NOL1/NOP2/fmu family ribosome biogenesis protein